MEKIREIFDEFLKRPLWTAIAGFALGLIIGLPVLGWGLWPVKWKDADASFLRQDLKDQYLCMVVDSFSVNKDANLAAARINSMGVDIKTTPFLFDNLAAGGCSYAASDEVVMTLKAALLDAEPVEAENEEVVTGEAPEVVAPAPTEVAESTEIPLPEETKPRDKSNGSVLLLSLLCALFLVIGGALIYFFFIRNRRVRDDIPPSGDEEDGYIEDDGYAAEEEYEEAPEYPAVVTPPPPPPVRVIEETESPDLDYFEEPTVAEVEQEVAEVVPVTKAAASAAPVVSGSGPVAHFMTTYVIGDDLYDDSFSIDAPNGSFLGECGVGISDTIGVGDPKKVTAFEVWLFDKNDIQTVTKVLMSAYAMNDTGIKQRLASKGEPVLIESGQQLLLETATLQLEAKVIEMVYGQGALPSGSFFQRMTLELSVWPK